MAFVIYKTKIQDFVKELKASELKKMAYITCITRERKKDVISYVVVLSAFNGQGNVMHLNNIFRDVPKHGIEANKQAKRECKAYSEKLEKYLQNCSIEPLQGILGALSSPIYGTIENEQIET